MCRSPWRIRAGHALAVQELMLHVQAARICLPHAFHAGYAYRFGGGVPGKQYALIKKDGIPIEQYIARTLDGT